MSKPPPQAQTPALFNPTQEHILLRQTTADFAKREIEPQALPYDRKEQFNLPLFKKMGGLGLLGLTAGPKWGGGGHGCCVGCDCS